MAVVSGSLRYLFILAPRTASTAVGTMLCQDAAGRWMPKRDLVGEDGTIVLSRKHATVRDLVAHGVLPERRAQRLYKFTAVRNTFDSLVSLYIKQRTAYQPLLDDPDSFVHRIPGFADDVRWTVEHTFSEWIERRYGSLRGQPPVHLYSPFIRGVDHIMRYEHLQSDLDAVLEFLGATPQPIPMVSPTEGREPEYRGYYDAAARDLVAEVFQLDLERFGYRF